MEDFGSLWSYQENAGDLKQKLLYTTLELETVKVEATEALRKHKEEVQNLLDLLKIAYQERNEAKNQLRKLLGKLLPSCLTTELNRSILCQVPHETPLLVVPTRANSSITESNSLSETYNNPQSHISSPVDSFFDAVSSPEFANINTSDSSNMVGGFVNQPFVDHANGSMSTGLVIPEAVITKIDRDTAVIDSIAKGKALPEQGKLLQVVMEAGPLLQTLLVAGPLPSWRNPPPLQAFKIPPFSINQNQAANPNFVARKSLNSSSSYLQIPRMMSSQICSASMLNFSSCPAGSGQSNGMLLTSGADIGTRKLSSGKRQRFH